MLALVLATKAYVLSDYPFSLLCFGYGGAVGFVYACRTAMQAGIVDFKNSLRLRVYGT